MGENDPDRSLEQAIAGLATPGVAIDYRRILPGDEDALLEEERASIPSLADRRRASGAARIVARRLLDQLGYERRPIPRGVDGAPVWPAGMTGSLSHDDQFAVAAVGRASDVGAIGIDIEPAIPLPCDMFDLVTTPKELSGIADDPLCGRLVFAAKEAVYKALFPVDRTFLEFRDIEVDLGRLQASTRTGRTVSIRCGVSSHLIVLATCRSIGALTSIKRRDA
jgi:4'-phosphopantetheinyl transferase EntD